MLETDRAEKQNLLRKEKRSQRQPKRRRLLEMSTVEEENMEGIVLA
jgi:hypothetical protein